MRQNFGTLLYKNLKEKGWQEGTNTLHSPQSTEAQRLRDKVIKSKGKRKVSLKAIKTADTSDARNIRNKEKQVDVFTRLIKQELNLELWPEYFFTTERQFRLDYAIPEYKIGIEVDGGIWAKGKSGHSSGTGITRDMEKANLLNVNGWTLIRRTPDQLLTNETIELIKKAINGRQKTNT